MSDVLKAAPVIAPSVDTGVISLPAGFEFNQVLNPGVAKELLAPAPPPTLGPLQAFVGTFAGGGFNTIFRPNSPLTPTPLPNPSTDPIKDNVLELNLTKESLAFSPSLGSVPNRGAHEADAFLNGVPYLQTVQDITDANNPVGIHVEPGIWICVPPTDEEDQQTLVRMASIPHGTTICAQGTSTTIAGPPTIPAAPITPFGIGSNAPQLFTFPSQTLGNSSTQRLPQVLAGSTIPITQAMLDDPNSVLRDHIAGQNIVSTTEISITTHGTPPTVFKAGGTSNIDFLAAAQGNANTVKMDATFWIETIEHVIHLPILDPKDPPVTLQPDVGHPALHRPTFIGVAPGPIPAGRVLRVHSTQIQYSQTVLLNFGPLSWPHVSVATLTPAGPILIPPGAWNAAAALHG